MQTTHNTNGFAELSALGEAITQLRTQEGFSTRDLASQIGVAHQRLLHIEAGRQDPGYQLLFALAEALGVTLVELIDRYETLAPTIP
jgi:transcriptional regulator with XRE-family HTH domain